MRKDNCYPSMKTKNTNRKNVLQYNKFIEYLKIRNSGVSTGVIADYTNVVTTFTGAIADYTNVVTTFTGAIADYTNVVTTFTGAIADYTNVVTTLQVR